MKHLVITGAAGFIGSCAVAFWNQKGFKNLLLVDDFDREDKAKNLTGKAYTTTLSRHSFLHRLNELARTYDLAGVIHLGARTDTLSTNKRVMNELNTEYSKALWTFCIQEDIPFIYASSAATYGLGEYGYSDTLDNIETLAPLNEYAQSKQAFDVWALKQTALGSSPKHWVGFKFFNVYGPNEYHKGRMASVVYHFYHQIAKTGVAKLFASANEDYLDGEQKRDFIYVKDVVKTLFVAWQNPIPSGLYNLGTGRARSFNDLAKAVFAAMDKPEHITYIPTPNDLKDRYQYFTEARMEKLQGVGLGQSFYTLEAGIQDYVSHYLSKQKTY